MPPPMRPSPRSSWSSPSLGLVCLLSFAFCLGLLAEYLFSSGAAAASEDVQLRQQVLETHLRSLQRELAVRDTALLNLLSCVVFGRQT